MKHLEQIFTSYVKELNTFLELPSSENKLEIVFKN